MQELRDETVHHREFHKKHFENIMENVERQFTTSSVIFSDGSPVIEEHVLKGK